MRDTIQPYFLRRLKSEVFGEDSGKDTKLSKKNEIIVWLKLTSCQVYFFYGFSSHCLSQAAEPYPFIFLRFFWQRQIYEAFLKSEIVLSAFDGSPLAALTVIFEVEYSKVSTHSIFSPKRLPTY